jgi:hypothetical protein
MLWSSLTLHGLTYDDQQDTQTDRHTDTQTDRQTHRHTDTHTDTQTHRHTDTQTHTQTHTPVECIQELDNDQHRQSHCHWTIILKCFTSFLKKTVVCSKVCVCVYVGRTLHKVGLCVRETETERERKRKCVSVCQCVSV